ncbi:MAG TPA: carboxylesterase family protein [Edaphocola sp.]|nr:carboxylesterase family protein [Edaphocola sp.]
MKNKTIINFLFLAYLLIIAPSSYAQQWVTDKYEYDSVLNVRYGTAVNFNGDLDSLEMDIYFPQCDDSQQLSKRPLLVWVHGGAFIAGDKADVTDMCKRFAKKGYVTATINYRLGLISDDGNWSCNFPNYSCLFAGDTAEWYRATYRAIQDVKGAIRFFVNRIDSLKIDENNIFVAGESAGAITALGVALMDTTIERWTETYALNKLHKPNSNALNCFHNQGKVFLNDSIDRPDLGGIDGNIEPTNYDYTIKGIGNFFGGTFSDLLEHKKVGKPKPAIFSFHQPCDLIVSIDQKKIFWGLTWCFTNGYNCYGISNTPLINGSRALSELNANNNYGYQFENNFTSIVFPYSFLFGQASCADQTNNTSCHDYDNKNNRVLQLAQFFAPLVSTPPICDTSTTVINSINKSDSSVQIYPNPSKDKLFYIETDFNSRLTWEVYNILGATIVKGSGKMINLSQQASGIYILNLKTAQQNFVRRLVIP